MSDTILKIISIVPNFTPTQDQQSNAKIFLSNVFGKDNIHDKETANVEFVDQGANFDTVSCNYCNKVIDIEVWQDAMDDAGEVNFNDLSFTTPCCGRMTTLNELEYNSPAGFAKFILTVAAPSDNLKLDEVKHLENILGTTIRQIWAHY